MTSIPDSTLIDENGKPPNDLESAKFTKDKETVDVIQPTAKLIGLTKEQLEQYRNDPFWKTVRYALFIAFWLVWLAMFVGAILIVVMSPKCVDVKWPDKMVAYKLFSLGFKDSDSGNDGNAKFGDFVGIKEKLAEIKDMGVSAIWPTPILNVDKNDHSPDAVVKLEIDNDLALGGLAKFKDLIKSAHAKDIKVIVDLPLTVASGNAANWAKGIQDAVKESQGPVSALNLKNQKVEESLIGLAREYIEWGIDGINLANYGLGDGDLSGLIQKIRQIAGAEHLPIYSDAAIPTNGDTYRTESLIGNERVKNVEELVGKLHAKIDEIMKQRGELKKEENVTTTTSLTVFNLGNLNRGGHRVDELLNDQNLTSTQKEKIAFLFTLVHLSIPGPISVLYGEELALLSGKAKEERNKTNLVEYPWTWNNSTNKGNNEFLLDPQNAATNNYEDQNKLENSALKIFSKVAKFHQQNDFILGDFKRISLGNVDAYLVKRGTDSASNYYGLIVNWNGNEQELDGDALSKINDAKKLSIVAATEGNFGDTIDFGKEGGSKMKIPAFGAVAFHTAE